MHIFIVVFGLLTVFWYLLVTFGEKIEDEFEDDDLQLIFDETNKFLEFTLHKLETERDNE